MTGHEVLRQLRMAKIETPILILSGDDATESKLKGFGFGADDYLTKPFHREELVARIHAIIRRSKGHSQSVIRTGRITVNLDTKTVEVGGSPVHLTGKEYQMLEPPLRKGTTLTKEMILNHLYGGMDEPELRSSTSSSASSARSSPRPRTATAISKRFGAAATSCATPSRWPATWSGWRSAPDGTRSLIEQSGHAVLAP
jgi:two-component system cell cycle response regulator CtrA